MNNVISLFSGGISNPTPNIIGKYSIDAILSGVMSGTWRELVEQARTIEDKKERQAFKIKYLPFFYPSAHLNGANREDGDAIEHTGLIALDIDGIAPERVKELLSGDPYLHVAFTSVSGNGVCALFSVDPPGLYGQDEGRSLGRFNIGAWIALAAYLLDRYNITADKSGKNIARARYVSYDPAPIGSGYESLPFPVKLEAEDLMSVAGQFNNVERPDLVIEVLKSYISAEVSRSYFTRDNLHKAGYDVSGYAHQQVIRIAWLCGGFAAMIGEAGRQLLAEHFLAAMDGKPGFERSTDARKWLDQYDRGTRRPLTIKDLPGAARIDWSEPEAGVIDPEDERSYRVQVRAAIYGNKYSALWVAQFSAISGLSLEFAQKAADEELAIYGDKMKLLRRKVQGVQFYGMCNLAGIKFAQGIGQPVHVETDPHRALSKEALRSIVEEYLGVRFGREAVSEGFARIHEGEQFDPVRDWLNSFEPWDGYDYIAELAEHFKSSNPALFERYLKLWLASTAKCALEEGFTNRFALVLTSGRQSLGKSYFFGSYLSDPHLYAEGLELSGREGDIGRSLASALIVNLEEFTAPKDVARLKKIISQPSLTGRAAHGRAPELFIRRASFAVCTNEPSFLLDVSNTRFLCSVLSDIDRTYSEKIPRSKVWAQAIALSRGAQREYMLDREELEELDAWNRGFIVVDNAEQFIRKYFEKADTTSLLSITMSSGDIQAYIERRVGVRSHEKAYREALRRLEWNHDGLNRYTVVEKLPAGTIGESLEEVQERAEPPKYPAKGKLI